MAVGEGAAVTIEVQNDGKKLISQGPVVAIPTEVKLELDGDKIKIGEDEKELKVMPVTASERAIEVLGEKYDTIELKEIGNTCSLFQFRIKLISRTRNTNIFPKFFA